MSCIIQTLLLFVIASHLMRQDGNAFELWFNYIWVAKRICYGDIVWGIIRVNFLPTQDRSLRSIQQYTDLIAIDLRFRSGNHQRPCNKIKYTVCGELFPCKSMGLEVCEQP